MMSKVNDVIEASNVAIESLKELSEKAKDITVEEAVFNKDNIEVTLSYLEDNLVKDATGSVKILSLLGERRKWRVFIIDKNFKTFKGFKAYHPSRK
ncbi:TPA: hypothetical protein ACXR0I_005381 [Klebsiella variicola subsp. variicola]|uniref:hypothetical protein n=1 Tax=Klebsiella TaxID=570 RepID=UPI0018DD3102|nr:MULTISPECIES: hypothetical protein [Klebsiella]HBS7658765.1 hypothetical protein [Klebsiella pneumoniae]HCB1306224.1 hypothetical protein [Klebsiella quasipneumoniae subsp. similipneumoniae]HDU3945203.1 hypothetical protein [Klebsiella pneumoniae subsp. pneumoniae]MBH8480502.1 hypothetical protein [Klebsiella quasipneumoniae]HBS8068694.1 hypothetical protein [Klebsiella pneumoniae]